MGLEPDPGSLQLDSAGLKKLFSHGIRRFKSRSKNRAPLSAFGSAMCELAA